ncbi:hypothetical protein AZE42_12310 [Rhizopogon vesiculosus]|uniref:Uncharacterized protein n=1 Tax=Rhizopogon vesiculosus TaxID=180088 RepID=A0A1J8PZT3_9AGAM|nr:hypothetical protein AZE42_12310 [Rhizopogon vesiculosus]
MTIVSNDPSWWPVIGYLRGISYFEVACFTAVVYDWSTHKTNIYPENY